MFSKIRTIFCIILFSVTTKFLQSQDYQRISIAPLLLDQESKYRLYLQKAFENLKLSQKANFQSIKNHKFVFVSDPQTVFDQNKIAHQLLNGWFGRQKDSSFSLDLVLERARYNASELDMIRTKMAQRGLAVLDENALELIDLTYVMSFRFVDVRSWKDIYDRKDADRKKSMGRDFTPVERENNGFLATVFIDFYKLNFDEYAQDYFYKNCWILESDNAATKKDKMKNFEQYPFKLEFIKDFRIEVVADQKNPGYTLLPQITDAKLWDHLVQTAHDQAFFKMEKIDPNFVVRVELFKNKPLRARIGKKEALFVDSRYFVYERIQEDGKIIEKRRGVIRAKKIIDNQKIANAKDTTASVFYQIGGKKLRQGDYLVQKNDIGFGIYTNYIQGLADAKMGIKGFDFGIDYNLGGLSRFTQMGAIPSFRIFGEIGFSLSNSYFVKKIDNNENTSFTQTKEKFDFFRWGIGLKKDFYFLRSFFLTPAINYWQEKAEATEFEHSQFIAGSSKADQVKIKTHGFRLGLHLGLQIAYPLSFFVKGYFDIPFMSEDLVDKKEYSIRDVTPFPMQRYQGGIGVGLRVEF